MSRPRPKAVVQWTTSAIVGSLIVLTLRPAEPRRVDPPTSADEIVLVFIAYEGCIGLEDPHFHDTLGRVRTQVAQYAASVKKRFVTVGISIDDDADVGVGMLARYGPFDEIHAGGSAINAAALRYLEGFIGTSAVPQIIVLQRAAVVEGGFAHVHSEEVILRKVGSEMIAAWAEAFATSGDGSHSLEASDSRP